MKETVTGYLLEKYNNMKGSYTCYRFLEEAAALGMKVEMVGALDLCAGGDAVWNGSRRLEQRDFLFNRYFDGAVVDCMSRLTSRSYNPTDIFRYYRNKFHQLSVVAGLQVHVPVSLMGTAALSWLSLSDKLGSQFVAKGTTGSMGHEVFLISNADDLSRLLEQHGERKEWVFQQYIRESSGRSLRLLSIRGRIAASIIRESEDDFRANVALGARTSLFPVDDALEELALQIYEKTRLDFVGIDVLLGDDGYYFCEFNVMQGLEGVESASHKNIAREMMLTIQNDFK